MTNTTEKLAEAASTATHAVTRTSPFGGLFIGRCILCGETGLKAGAALEPCPNPRGVTPDDALIACIED